MENKSLCDWWNRQRLQYTKCKVGTKSTLREEQIRLLDNLEDGRWRRTRRGERGGGGGGEEVNGGGGTKTARRLWQASADSETDEDQMRMDVSGRELIERNRTL